MTQAHEYYTCCYISSTYSSIRRNISNITYWLYMHIRSFYYFCGWDSNQDSRRKRKEGNEKGKQKHKTRKKGRKAQRREDADLPTWGWQRWTRSREKQTEYGGYSLHSQQLLLLYCYCTVTAHSASTPPVLFRFPYLLLSFPPQCYSCCACNEYPT